MRLNPDCIRDILLTVEEHSLYMRQIVYDNSDNFPRLSKYTMDELFYHFNQCRHMGYFLSANLGSDTILIGDLSPEAHEFLENIRQDNTWAKTKNFAAKSGSFAISVLAEIAKTIVSSLVQSHMQ